MSDKAIKFSESSTPNILEMKNINMTFGNNVVIQDLSFLIEKAETMGKIISLCGESGCGKSLTLRMVCGLQKPTSGTILINNTRPNPDKCPGMIFQAYSSFPWLTVLENVRLGLDLQKVPRKEADERAMQLLELVHLEAHAKKYARSSTTGRDGGMSGGQLQRIAIARSLAVQPEIILMDEPCGALDVSTRLSLEMTIGEICEKTNTTVVIVTHFPDEAIFLGDEVWVMAAHPGRIMERIHVPFSIPRDRAIKRDPQFMQMAGELEEMIMERASI